MKYILLLLFCFMQNACATQKSYSEQALNTLDSISQWNNVEYIAQKDQEETHNISFLTDLINLEQLSQLNEIIQSSLLNNPSLQQQIIAAEMLMFKNKIVRSARIPSFHASITAQENLESSIEGSSEARLEINWELDLWLKLRDKDLSVQEEVLAEQANLQAFHNSLIAQIMQTYILWASNLQLLKIEKSYYNLLQKDEKIIAECYKHGLVPLYDLEFARANTLQAKAAITALNEEIKTYERQLSRISGQNNLILENEISLPNVLLPLAKLPKQSLEGRPDLQAAYHKILANEHNARATYKEMLPSINVQTLLSSSATNPSDILSGSFVWGLLGQMVAPLFQAGRLKNEAHLADLETEMSYYAYRENLLKAVEEVSNALGQENALNEQEELLSQAMKSAVKSQTNFEKRYREGIINILDLFQIQKNTFEIERQLLKARTNRLNNRIKLALALGLGIGRHNAENK